MDPSKKYVIVELNDGFKVEGVLTDVDKTNFTIHISEATKYRTDEKGNNIPEKLTSSELNISKGDIKEVKLVQYDQLSAQKQIEERTLPQMNNIHSTPNQYTGLPTTQLPRLKDITPKYEKKDFFDGLSLLNNKDQVKQTIRDNEKNKETFNLPEREYNNNFQGNRGGYRKRGRGQYRGGNYNNNYRNNPMFSYDNETNNNITFNSFNYNQRRGGNKYEGSRGGNRGNFNNNGRGGNRGGRGNRNFNNYNNFNNMNNNMNNFAGNNFNTFNDDHDDKCEERGKSIYDL